jgi:hypothetical protein
MASGAIECCHDLAPAHRKQISAARPAPMVIFFAYFLAPVLSGAEANKTKESKKPIGLQIIARPYWFSKQKSNVRK